MIQFFYSPSSRTMKAFKEAVSSDLLRHIDMHVAYADKKPRQAHLVLVSGEGKPSAEVERYAARIGAYCVCVPEASEWLTRQVRDRVETGMPLVMVDSALASTKQLSGSK